MTASEERTPDERRVDVAMLLSLWARSSTRPREDAGDKLRQMKLAFLASHALAAQRIRALTLEFYRWTWGPMSNQVYDAWTSLEQSGLMDSEEHFVLTRRGADLAESFYAEVLMDERNVAVRQHVDAVANDWRGRPQTGPLLDHVYAMSIIPIAQKEPRTIRDIPRGVELLVPVPLDDARTTLSVPRGWLETLALVFVPGAARVIQMAVDDYRAGRVDVVA
jgi:hypothetical protein